MRCNDFSHTPCGAAFSRVFEQSGYLNSQTTGYELGENIAWGTASLGSARSIMAEWLHSPGHRANILTPTFRQMGLAYVESPGSWTPRAPGSG